MAIPVDRTEDDFQHILIPTLADGINVNQDTEQMKVSQALQLQNLIVSKNKIERDTGYSEGGVTIRGAPRLIYQHITTTGSSSVFLITNLTVYRQAGTDWEYVSDSNETTLDANEASGQTVISVTITTPFSVLDDVGIRLNDGTQHRANISSIVAGVSITIDVALPSAADSGNAVVKATDLVGDDNNQVFAVSIPWDDSMVFTNNVDNVMQWDATADDIIDVPNLPGSGNTQCVGLAVFDSSLILLNTTEGGTPFPQRERHSDKANKGEWVTGVAGFNDFLDYNHPIRNGHIIGPYLAIYRSKSISRLAIAGTTSTRFIPATVVTGMGAISPAAIAVMEDQHLVVGEDDIYLYKGGFDTQSIESDIKDLIFGAEGELDDANSIRLSVFFIKQKDSVFVFYNTLADTLYPAKALRYYTKRNAWTTRVFPSGTEISGIGTAVDVTGALTWNNITGDWSGQTIKWNSGAILGSAPIFFLLDSGANGILEYDFLSTDDDGTAIPYTIETKDFANPNFLIRHDYVEMKVAGNSVLVEYSIDEGASWITLETISPGATAMKVRIEKQFVTRIFRYRLTGSSGFEFHWLNTQFRPEYEY